MKSEILNLKCEIQWNFGQISNVVEDFGRFLVSDGPLGFIVNICKRITVLLPKQLFGKRHAFFLSL